MNERDSFYWHDYETFGTDPCRDRPAQFAGQRTTLQLDPVGEPLVIYCKPAADVLPQPQACLVTGISPQHAEREGLGEADFAARIQEELAQPGTCGAGYNSIRFDDEFLLFGLYRNFYDPYERGDSEGEFSPFVTDMDDGADITSWIAKQPFCNGKVGMWGGSYLGYSQWATAKERPPHLTTIVPTAADA